RVPPPGIPTAIVAIVRGMSKLRSVWLAAMLAWPASSAAAQQVPVPEAPPPDPAPSEAAAPPSAAPPEAAAPERPRYAPRPIPPPPIMVVVLTSGRVPDDVA